MKKLIFVLILNSLFSSLIAQSGWFNTYNGPGNNKDIATSLAIDDSGNVIVSGYSRHGSTEATEDWAIIKRDPYGARTWVSRLNGPGDSHDRAYDVVVDNDYNIIVAGYIQGVAGQYFDYTVVKFNPSGNPEWTAIYNGPSNYYDIAYAVTVDGSGNVYVTGGSWTWGSNYDIRTIKYNSQGDSVWSTLFSSGPGWDKGQSIAIYGSGYVIVSGTSGEHVNANIVTIKYSPSGNESWVDQYNGLGNGADYGRAMVTDDAGNVYVCGTVYNGSPSVNGSLYDLCTIKYNSAGNTVWVKELTSPGGEDDGCNDIAVDSDGNVYVTGYFENDPQTNNFDCITIKYKSNGQTEWTAYYGKPDTTEMGNAIDVDSAGNVYVTGISDENIFTIKYDQDGVEQWIETETNGGYQTGTDIEVDKDGSVIVSGYGENFPGNYDYITIKYSDTSIAIPI